MASNPSRTERDLVQAACGGDEEAFRRLVDPYRSRLRAHCYRMLRSSHDAEDALQDALVRAWRGLCGFAGRSAVRNWLYRIATNSCLDAIARRPKRVLPIDYAAADELYDAGVGSAGREALGIADGGSSPDARYEQREATELAFAAALELLPPRQLAVLTLRDLLGLSAKEVSESLGVTVPSVNSALQRAHRAINEQRGARSLQSASLHRDGRVRELARRFVNAVNQGDVDTVVELVTADATFAPPARAA